MLFLFLLFSPMVFTAVKCWSTDDRAADGSFLDRRVCLGYTPSQSWIVQPLSADRKISKMLGKQESSYTMICLRYRLAFPQPSLFFHLILEHPDSRVPSFGEMLVTKLTVVHSNLPPSSPLHDMHRKVKRDNDYALDIFCCKDKAFFLMSPGYFPDVPLLPDPDGPPHNIRVIYLVHVRCQ